MNAFTLQLHLYSDIAKVNYVLTLRVVISCQVGINFRNVASDIPICSSNLVLFYVSKLEVNCVKFIYSGIRDGKLYFEWSTVD